MGEIVWRDTKGQEFGELDKTPELQQILKGEIIMLREFDQQ
jgi:hypothetical protein